MDIYERVKSFLELSNDFKTIRNIAIELLENGSDDYEIIYQSYQKEIDTFYK